MKIMFPSSKQLPRSYFLCVVTIFALVLLSSQAQGQAVIATLPPSGFLALNTVTNTVYLDQTDGEIYVVDGATNTVNYISTPGKVGTVIAVNPVTNRVYATVNNSIEVVDGATRLIVATIVNPGGFGLTGLLVNAVTNKIYAVGGNSNNLAVIDGATNATALIPVASAGDLVVNSTTNKIYVGSGTNILEIDGSTNAATLILSAASASKLALNPVTNKIYAANLQGITVIDGVTHAAINIPGGSSPQALAVNSVTNKIYVLNSAGTVTVVDGSTNATNTISDPNAKGPLALAVNPVTNKIYVANGGSNNISVFDGLTNAVVTLKDTNAIGPEFLVVNSLTNRVYVSNYLSHNLTVIDGSITSQVPPSCQLSSIVAGPPKQLIVSMQDTTSGLQNISVVQSVNASITLPPFLPGTNSVVSVTATKLNQNQSSNVGFVVTNTAGLSTSCDPVDFTVELEGGTERHVFRSLPASEHYVRIVNGAPGVQHMSFLVNGHAFSVPDLEDGEDYLLDIGSAMVGGHPALAANMKTEVRGPGKENNNVVMQATGSRGSSAYVLVGDASVK